jgi:hypothetical protein
MDVSVWQRAVEQSKALLTQEELALYAASGPEDIVKDFENSRKIKAQTSRVERALSRIQPFVVTLERYGKSLDVIANAAPRILSPVWGTMRALLMVCPLVKNKQSNYRLTATRSPKRRSHTFQG